MATILWEGAAPPPSLSAQLAAEGHQLVTKGAAGLSVVCTASARVPSPSATGLPWVWACRTRIPSLLTTEAALAGAYDSVWLGAEDGPRRLLARLAELATPEPAPESAPTFVARSAAARATLHQIARAARTSQPVLITGETGSGKEVTARLLHTLGERRAGRFVPINCAAIPNELMEGELFGYAKGAFSGATRGFDGQLMAAEGGTVFLDEIDDTPLSLQMKLLRVLEDRVVTRLGESEPKQVDFRIVAATNRDLRELIARGVFGADLYERLAIVSIQLPPLRERLEDLPVLLEHFITRFQREEPSAPRGPVHVTPEALAALEAYPWPGNIRELRNVIFEVLVYKRVGEEILPSDLPKRVLRRGVEHAASGGRDAAAMGRAMDAGSFNLRAEVEALERLALTLALERTGGNASRSAALLGEVGRGRSADPGATVRAMMRRFGISGRR
ncbi:sigma-54-dependent Fis family transcriptional regulator [Vitiosangium sp. GDMCC 1.1324]|uniref:sigma-54 interaction domain-containing protein n=1 Tax=Vitiosangium sp. (strain GDMCC 1.1324) TaxID=2138576 RepID=UPI00130D5AEA|nr:sigma-54 dependent transcriptional regulator [Vitiosangium sp. GDMCC 1.1324]